MIFHFKNRQEPFYLPPIGQRIVKTAVAVFITLAVYALFGYRGESMPNEAAITAIICVQPYVRDTRDFALSRLLGSLIGSFWGLAYLALLLVFPGLGRNLLLLYTSMALGVLLSLYSSVLLHRADAASLAAIVFICIVVTFPEISQPLEQSLSRIVGVLLGTAASIAVNLFRLPRVRLRHRVFFVRARDLASDRFSHISNAVLLRLNYLYEDGARICLMSEHAPAFFTLQMHEAMLQLPLIVMDGAAIYDPRENVYFHCETIAPAENEALRAELFSLGLSYFIYTIHKNKTCIFHQGKFSPQERAILERMKGSPYRSYLEGESYDSREIIYYKIIAEDSVIAELETCLQERLAGKQLRAVSRPQAVSGISGLYIYSANATLPLAEQRVMDYLRREDPELEGMEIFSPVPYRNEHDAMHLLSRISRAYEPLAIVHALRKR